MFMSPQNSYFGILMPNVIVLDWGLWKVISL